MSATFGGGWDAQLALPWDELILRWIEVADVEADAQDGGLAALLGLIRG